jgi:hypothetical protein
MNSREEGATDVGTLFGYNGAPEIRKSFKKPNVGWQRKQTLAPSSKST